MERRKKKLYWSVLVTFEGKRGLDKGRVLLGSGS